MMRTMIWIVVFSGLWTAGRTVGDEPAKKPATENVEPTNQKEASIWMKLKLDYAQKILQGLAEADYDKIALNAEAMQGFSKFEGLLRRRPKGYAAQLEIFKDANAELIKQANRGNLDGSVLAFTQLTISCVNCHKRIRGE